MFRWLFRPKSFMIILLTFLLVSFVAYLNVTRNAGDVVQPPEEMKKQPSLTFANRKFYLNGQPMQILSGTIHYFRVPAEYWRDRLLKLRAAGFNAVETYAPWNLHEEQRGSMSFKGMLDVRQFFKLAQELGLHVIFRPGPYICAEWEFGGMPGWLLADPNMRVRSMYVKFTQAVDDYFKMIMNEISDLQYSRGGPIIAFQVENEYGNYGDNAQYVKYIASSLRRYGAVEAFFTSDGIDGIAHSQLLPGAFAGINYNKFSDGKRLISIVRSWSKELPVFASELWTGWFAGWGATKDQAIGTQPLMKTIQYLLEQGASLNLYMFHGGTNFAFMNGYNGMDGLSLITSYDYGAPLSESGHVTEKYEKIRELIMKQLPAEILKTLPPVPEPTTCKNYGSRAIQSVMQWEHIVDLAAKPVLSERIKFMEEVGQNFGFILYRSSLKAVHGNVTINGRVADRAIVLLNAAPLNSSAPNSGTIYYPMPDNGPASTTLSLIGSAAASTENTLDVLVENLGRVNYAPFQSPMFNKQRKGIVSSAAGTHDATLQSPGSVSVDGIRLRSYKIVSLDFSQSYVARASVSKESWLPYSPPTAASVAPGLYRTVLDISSDEEPKDTFVDMGGWVKGVVFVNGFNIGRYWQVGPQLALYLPAPLLRKGANEVLIFELHRPAASVKFSKLPAIKFTKQ